MIGSGDMKSKKCIRCGETKQHSSFHKQTRSKDGLQTYCKVCRADIAHVRRQNPDVKAKEREALRRWRKENPDKYSAQLKRRDRQKILASARRYYHAHREECLERHRRWLLENAERNRELCRQWRKRNPDRNAELSNRYRAAKMKQTPPWLTKRQFEEMQAKYALARKLSSAGSQYHVDHIYPLRGKDAWGLHVPWNLQTIPARENNAKYNKLPHELAEDLP